MLHIDARGDHMIGIDLSGFPQLTKFKDTVAKREGVKKAMKAEGLI